MRKLNNSHVFSKVRSVRPERSVFNMSSSVKTTLNCDSLVPLKLYEVIPGDTFKLSVTFFGRISTLVAPFMDNLRLRYFAFFVPNRLVWTNWEAFISGAEDGKVIPGDKTYSLPLLSFSGVGNRVGTLADYFGLPLFAVSSGKKYSVNILPFRAYQQIFNDWFRDENLLDVVTFDRGNATFLDTDSKADRVMWPHLICKSHDYFTSALPWPQKGDAVHLPFVVSGDFKVKGEFPSEYYVYGDGFSDLFSGLGLRRGADNVVSPYLQGTSVYPPDLSKVAMGIRTVVDADVTPGSFGSNLFINDLRQAFQLQKMLERDARGGTRYTELIRSHFGVFPPDYRLQRAEYLGGGSTFINVNSVAQTSATSGTSPQGNLAAAGTVSDGKFLFSRSFTEHGFVFVLCNVVGDTSYSQGMHKIWTRSTRYDYYWPSFAHLGEQPILNREIYFSGDVNKDTAIFGYQERYSEYRYDSNSITGLMRPDVDLSLANWHLGQYFKDTPALSSFIYQSTPIDRVLAVTDQPAILLDAFFDCKAYRPMPVYAEPGLIDHF